MFQNLFSILLVCALYLWATSLLFQKIWLKLLFFSTALSANRQEGNGSIADVTAKEKLQPV